MYPSIELRKGRENVIKRKHPWIFSRALRLQPDNITEGDIVKVVDFRERFLAIASYHKNNIALRILSFDEEVIDTAFFTKKIAEARQLRQAVGLPSSHTNCFRAIHGEGDGLSGLIIDIYHNTAVVQCHHIGMYKRRKEISQALLEVYGDHIHNVYIKSEKTLSSRQEEILDGYIIQSDKNPPDDTVVENGVKFRVDWLEGQKTGFFLDQRDNRQLLASLASDKSVLNCFCYTGGFSMYALQAGARAVTSVDVSASAIDRLNENYEINGYSNKSEALCADVMKYLKDHEAHQWDIVIVDPPAFAKNISKKHNAVIAYKRLNARALQCVKPGGMLFTFSCSQVVDTELFYNTITASSIECGRNIRVIHKMMQGPDHPVNIFHPEGSYLKGMVLYVE